MTSVLTRREKTERSLREQLATRRRRWEGCVSKPSSAKDCWQHQKLREGPGTDSPREPLESAWPCRHPRFRLLASRFGREDISVVLNHPGLDALLWQAWKRRHACQPSRLKPITSSLAHPTQGGIEQEEAGMSLVQWDIHLCLKSTSGFYCSRRV